MSWTRTVHRRLAQVKRAGVGVAAHSLRVKGFSSTAARKWVRLQARDLKQADAGDLVSLQRLHRSGDVARLRAPGAEDTAGLITPREYLYLDPLNRRRRWLLNRVTAGRFVPGLSQYLSAPLCTIFSADGVLDQVRLTGFPADIPSGEQGLLELIQELGNVRVQPVHWDRGVGRNFRTAPDGFLIDGWPADGDDVIRVLHEMSSTSRCVVIADSGAAASTGRQLRVHDAVLRLYVGKRGRSVRVLQADCLVGDKWIPSRPDARTRDAAWDQEDKSGWSRRRQHLALGENRFAGRWPVDLKTAEIDYSDRARRSELAEHRPATFPKFASIVRRMEQALRDEEADFNFISVDVALTPAGELLVLDLSGEPEFPSPGGFTPEASRFLLDRLNSVREYKTERGQRAKLSHKAQRKARKLSRSYSTFRLRARGFTGRSARTWTRRVNSAKSDVDIPLSRRRAAIKNGFTPGTFNRFGIDEDNRDGFVSLRDYLFVQPLNGTYAKWVRDRVSTQKVFEPYQDLFEPIHYQVLRRNSELQILPVSEEAKGYGSSMVGISLFLRHHGGVHLMSSAWAGKADLAVSYENDAFVVDGVTYTPDEFGKLLTSRVRHQFYVLTDRSENDSAAAVFSTQNQVELRLTMINEAGTDPFLAEAYVVGHEPGTARDAFVESGTVIGEETPGREETVTEDEEDLEADLAQQQQRSEDDDPSGVNVADDIDVENEDDAVVLPDVDLVGRLDLAQGTVHGARSLIEGRLREHEQHPVTGDELTLQVPDWDALVEQVLQLARFAPQLRFFEFSVVLTAAGPRITACSATPRYPQHFAFSPETVEFLEHVAEQKHASTNGLTTVVGRWLHNAKLKIRREFAEALYPEGLVPYQSVRWLTDMARDFVNRNGVSAKDKLWAYKQGFLSYRLPQYGITEENREEFISDFEYRWLRHINKKYKYWLEDKISIKYVAAEFNDSLPAYYYFIASHKGTTTFVPMMDAPEGTEDAGLDDVLALLREKGVLAFKPDEGSHGAGFYRAAFENGGYTLNGEPATEADIEAVLCGPESRYLVTEFIIMHPEIARIYPNSVNTIRMIVFKKDGVTPQLGNAYLRIGSSRSGYVDNTAAGGMLAEIDTKTGHFGHGQTLEHGRIKECSHHPDTGELIDGTIPHWDEAVAEVLAIAESLPQLEYLGFDIAITEDGIKIPEINRSPDYPRIDKLTPETIDYLLHKLQTKKKLYGYDKHRPKKLISLPIRGES